MLKILQARLQQYMMYTVQQLSDVQTGITKGRGTRFQVANICLIIEKAREFQKNIYFSFIDPPKPLTVWITTNCGKFLKRWEYEPTYLPPEKSVCRSGSNRTGHGTDWFQIGKGVHQGCILSPCLFNFYADYIMRNAGLGEVQYADDNTLMPESEELKSLLKVREESEKVGLKLNIKETKIMHVVPSFHGK